ncbi:MAG: type II CAAX endopeptidase family protein [Planctomycetota bacterium]
MENRTVPDTPVAETRTTAPPQPASGGPASRGRSRLTDRLKSLRPHEPWVLAFACLLPTAVTYAYFFVVAYAPAAVQQTVYAVGKGVQFALPVVWVGLVLRGPLGGVRLTTRGVATGLAFGTAAGLGSVLLYWAWFRHTELFQAAAAPIVDKVDGLGIGSPAAFLAVGVFYAFGHSLLEEYYWRWFVFRRMRRWLSPPLAIGLSSGAFMLHHVFVVDRYFHDTPLVTALLSLSVMIGGVFWAWLYRRSGSLLGPWLSHLLIDAAIFAIGYAIVFGAQS